MVEAAQPHPLKVDCLICSGVREAIQIVTDCQADFSAFVNQFLQAAAIDNGLKCAWLPDSGRNTLTLACALPFACQEVLNVGMCCQFGKHLHVQIVFLGQIEICSSLVLVQCHKIVQLKGLIEPAYVKISICGARLATDFGCDLPAASDKPNAFPARANSLLNVLAIPCMVGNLNVVQPIVTDNAVHVVNNVGQLGIEEPSWQQKNLAVEVHTCSAEDDMQECIACLDPLPAFVAEKNLGLALCSGRYACNAPLSVLVFNAKGFFLAQAALWASQLHFLTRLPEQCLSMEEDRAINELIMHIEHKGRVAFLEQRGTK